MFPSLAIKNDVKTYKKKSPKSKDWVNDFKSLREGRVYKGSVKKVLKYGLLISIKLRKKEEIGLAHIS